MGQTMKVEIDFQSANFLMATLRREMGEEYWSEERREDFRRTAENIDRAWMEALVRNCKPIVTHPDVTIWEHPRLGENGPLIIEDLFDKTSPVLYLKTPFHDADDLAEIFDWLEEMGGRKSAA